MGAATMTTFIFVRHGQSESNLAKVFTGQGHVNLTQLGQEQARKTAEYLKDRKIDVIYSSDLARAMQTAEPTARMHGLEILPNPAFREIFAGEWEGKLYTDLMEQYPESFATWRENIGLGHPDGGERVSELCQRVTAELERLLKRHRGQCVAVFSHATPIRALACRWFGKPIEEMAQVPWAVNASVSIVEYEDDGSFRLVLYAYADHQGENRTTLPAHLV